MPTLLVKNAEVLVTMDGSGHEIPDGGLYSTDGWIDQVGPTAELPAVADEVVDATGHIVIPGLINTHHHFYQTLTRAYPGTQDSGLFDWLTTLYPVWGRMTSQDVRLSTQLALVELARSGCTTSSDHLYVFPGGSRLDDQIEAARPTGMRLHAARGSMSLGESAGGLPPDALVETEEEILADTERLLSEFHDPGPGSMTQVVVAPCSPFSVTPDAMRDAVGLARSHRATLHTHLAETLDEERFCVETFDRRPVELAEDLGWMGSDVWFAHGVFVNKEEIVRMAAAGTGVAHCPTSNMRLASGIAPVAAYRAAGVHVGLGVDGSASNDGSDLLAEARQAMLVARLAASPQLTPAEVPQMSVREALTMATVGGAQVLGRDDVGALEVGKAADFAAFDLSRIGFAGGRQDPVAALLLCAPAPAAHTYVHGRPVIRDGQVVTLDEEELVAAHNDAARRLASAH